jgi:5-oxopent-3-ene-1,2,5-tricarboxylate decarboxylase/2-hydroxyhepta-2,4-diene-1,7-dioate isomerase
MPALAPKDAELFEKLTMVAIDSLWGVLDKLGYPDTFIEGVRPVHRDLDRKMVGRAMTLRYLPIRKDLAESIAAKHEHGLNIRTAEETTPGTVIVVEAGGETGGGFWGDVIATRFKVAGGAGVVTDGAIRDLAQIRGMDLAVYVRGTHPAASSRRIMAVDYNIPIRCSGVTVLPGDILVGDAQGVIVVPAHLAADVAERAIATEEKENYIRNKLLDGATIYGNYPPNETITREFEEWKKHK